jgi:hypothetical protein
VQPAREGGAAFVMLYAVPPLPPPTPRRVTPGDAAGPTGSQP